MSITNANIKASGEIAVGPLLKHGSSSASSSVEKDGFKGHETLDHATKTGHGIDPSKHNVTFETFGDESFYTPIDTYEGKHRYDPTFEWEPKEEKKLVRKVRIVQPTLAMGPLDADRRSWISAFAPLSASCSLRYSLTAATSPKPYPTTCSTISR